MQPLPSLNKSFLFSWLVPGSVFLISFGRDPIAGSHMDLFCCMFTVVFLISSNTGSKLHIKQIVTEYFLFSQRRGGTFAPEVALDGPPRRPHLPPSKHCLKEINAKIRTPTLKVYAKTAEFAAYNLQNEPLCKDAPPPPLDWRLFFLKFMCKNCHPA